MLASGMNFFMKFQIIIFDIEHPSWRIEMYSYRLLLCYIVVNSLHIWAEEALVTAVFDVLFADIGPQPLLQVYRNR